MQQTQRCENCKKDIPVAKAGTHFGYCKRNVIKCSECGGMFDKNFLQEHQDEFHASQQCRYCLLKFKKNDVASHLLICAMKPKVCQYCELDVPVKMFNNHLKICQARTQKCDLCQDSISNKDYEQHRRICRGKVSLKQTEKKSRRNEGWDQFQFEDSLTKFEKQLNKDQNKERRLKKETEKSRVAEVKEQNFISKAKREHILKGEKQSSPFKRLKQSQIKRQAEHFFDSGLFQDTSFNDLGYEYYQNSFNTSPYEQQLLFSSFNRREVHPRSREQSNQPYEDDISIEDQFLQEALFDNSKRSRVSKKKDFPSQIPKDFMSEEILNSSFYGKDILDIEKQKAIEKQIQMSKKSSKMYKRK